MGGQKVAVVILSTADFNAPLWTNKQHIASRLSAFVPVIYLESFGLREPRLSLSDLRRVLVKLRPSRVPRLLAGQSDQESVAGDLTVIKVRVLPWHRWSLIRHINRWILERTLFVHLPKEYVLWSFSPVTYGLESSAIRSVYHSVDLLHTIRGLPRGLILREEASFANLADFVLASSKGVLTHIKGIGRADVLLWENVADVELFESLRSNLRENRVIFAGNLTAEKLDVPLIRRLIDAGICVALAGPMGIDGTPKTSEIAELVRDPRIEYLGVLDQIQLAKELGKSRVGIIPYLINEYTAGVFPMKVYEYLASGLPVVATRLPSLIGITEEGLTLADGSHFLKQVQANLSSNARIPAVGSLSRHSWTNRIDEILSLLDLPRD